eukprot:c925_g1_i1.p1 GENE.c925_g1_i1~~c925_g1_i1.p1  ORF type:complete len:113 (+),score=13.24 c925_g1_i1:16-354(+)
MEVKPRKRFRCELCPLDTPCDYFGRRPPFNTNIVFFEDTYVLRVADGATKPKLLILGSRCSECARVVCVSPACSIYYTKRYCAHCAHKYIAEFPPRMRTEIERNMGPAPIKP